MPLFLSDEEFSRCSGNAALVAERADDFIRRLNVELETVKAQADAAAITAEQTCSLLEQKYLTLTSDFSDLQSQCTQLQASLDQRLVELADVQAQKSQVHLQCIEKDGEIERLSTEMSHLQTSKRQLMQVLEHKDAEISEKNMSIKAYLDKIGQLIDNASQKDARLNEKEAELARVQATCSRLLQEKELIQRQNTWLNDELKDKVDSLLETRRTIGNLEAQMSSKIAEAEREFNDCSSSLKWNKERVRELEGKVTSLQEELRSCKESAAANEEQFSAELSTVHKLVELYKESSEEWSRKAGELEGVIKALEVHLSQVENDYKDKLDREVYSRRQAEKEVEDLKAKLEKCEADIESLRKQNELNLFPLDSYNTERWTGLLESNDNVEVSAIVPRVPTGVSGTALAASLLRDGWSLVKMYTKYQESVDALRHEQMGRKEAEAVLQRVLYELEEKADVILDERAEHERMVEAYSAINEKLQESTSQQYNLEKTIQGLKADLKKHERDYQLAQHEITDLRSQVTVLLKECRDIQLRCGSDSHESDEEMVMDAFELNEESDIEKIIRERLLTFKDIHGLVEQNVKLRSLVRNLSHQIDDQEAEFKVKFEMELKKHTEEAASKVAAVLQRAEEQAQMIESLHASVAMYKRLYEEEHKRHSTPPEAVNASQEDGRADARLLIQGSQEAAKRMQEKAAERVRCLEEEIEKSRSKIIALQSERDKLALEAEFFREKADSLMKESEHKRGELDGVLSRNVEFSQLIVDYQRRLRDGYESLQAAEDQTRKLTMEVSVLKQEKEVLANAEKRASDEVKSLSERVYRLQATLDTIQSAEGVREEGRVADKGKQEEYLNKIQREWAEAKKELQNERDNVRNLTRERDVPLRDAMKQVEEMRKELANALQAGAAAESRAAVAEARLSDLERMIKSSNSKGDGGASDLANEIVSELQISKEEMEKLKEEAKANKEHMMQYKSIAQVNEAALKQMEHAHETFKAEAERLKNSLEAEVLSLRERISELENHLNMKSAEVASLIAGREEVLVSISTEVSSLKEEIVVKSSQMLQLETRNSLLEEKWKSEHERWRSAQANYERQVVLQSETIQELTRTSEAFSLLEKEACALRRSADDLKRENTELESKLLEAKSVLEEITISTEKKYNELNEQNKLLHDRLEALHIQLAEKDRYGRTSGGLGQDPAGDSGLQSVINYLRRSKEIGETEISLLKQEKWRLQSQLESAMKAAESAQATLQADRASLKASMITEEEFKSLQLQIRELKLLRESNEQLREENKHNFEECQRLREVAQKARAESESLEEQLSTTQNLVEACKKEIEMHKEEKSHLEKRIVELLERCGSIDVEQYERMKNEVSQLQEKLKEKDAQIEGIKVLASQRQDKITQLEKDLQNVKSELSEKEKRLQDISQIEQEKQRRLVAQFKRKTDAATKEKEDLVREKQALLKQLKEKEDLAKEKQALLKQLEDLKQVERPGADVNAEQVMKEKEEKDTRIQTLERALQNLRDNLKKERDRRQQSEKTIMESLKRADEGKTKVTNELEMHKQALKQLSSELEKIKHAEGSLPEGTSVVQLLSGNALDDLASGYLSALESFEQVAHSLTSQLGVRPPSQEAPETPLLTPAVAAQVATGAPDGSNTAAAKPTEDKEKATASPKRVISENTRRVARRLVRPPGPPRSSSAADEPPHDVDMAEGGTQEPESVPSVAAPQQHLRKRQASPAPPEAVQEPSDVAAPLIKRSKVQDDATTSQVEPDPVVNEKEGDLQMEECQEKTEDESDPLPAEVGEFTEEVQAEQSMEENMDSKPEGEAAADELGDQAEEAPENDDKEEGDVAALDVVDDIVGSPEPATEEAAEMVSVASPVRVAAEVAVASSPVRVAAEDVDVEAGEIVGEGEDGEITEETAEEKNEQAPEIAAAEAPAVVASEQGSTSPTPTFASGSAAAPGEVTSESKQQQQRASPSSTIVNLRKSAEAGAAERMRRLIPTTAPSSRGGRVLRGRGRAGRAVGRGKPSGGELGGQGPQGSSGSR